MRFSFRALVLAPLLVLAATIARPSFAEWYIQCRKVDYSGTKTVNMPNPSFYDVVPWDYVASSAYKAVLAPAKQTKAVANVKFEVYAIWYDPLMEEGGGETSLPPDRVFVKETFSGRASANPYVLLTSNSYPTWYETSGSASVSLPFGTPQPDTEPLSETIPDSTRVRVVENSSRSYEVFVGQYDLDSTASVTIPDRGIPWTDQFYSSASAQNTYKAVLVDRGLTIENELGTTYYKANEATIVGYTRKPNKREQDGSKKDDTVATYGQGTIQFINPNGFMGKTWLHALLHGSLEDLPYPFSSKLEAIWEKTGRGELRWLSSQQHANNCDVREYRFEGVGKDSMPMKSTFTAKVTDRDGITHKDQHSIVWHVPQENHALPNGTSGSPAEFAGYEQISQGVRPTDARPGTPIYIKLKNPSATVKENGDAAVGITGLVLGIGGLAATIFLPDGYAWVPPLMADVIGPAIGVAWALGSPNPLPDESCSTDFGVFETAVSEQKVINQCRRDGVDPPDSIKLPGVARIMPTDTADGINSGNIQAYFDGVHGPFTVSATKVVGKVKVTYIADGYGADGYTGDVFPNKTVPHSQYKVVTFRQGGY